MVLFMFKVTTRLRTDKWYRPRAGDVVMPVLATPQKAQSPQSTSRLRLCLPVVLERQLRTAETGSEATPRAAFSPKAAPMGVEPTER